MNSKVRSDSVDQEGYSYIEVIFIVLLISILVIPIYKSINRINRLRERSYEISNINNYISEMVKKSIYLMDLEDENEEVIVFKENGKEYNLRLKSQLKDIEDIKEFNSKKLYFYHIKIFLNNKLYKEYEIKKFK